MGLFNKKTEEKKQPTVKAAKVSNDKKTVKTEVEAKSMKDLYGGAEAGNVKQSAKDVVKKSVHGNAYKIIMKPLVTEKVSGLGALNKYVFAVAKNANKIEVAKAIKEVYGIKPIGVNVIRMSGKKARYGRISGKRKDWKKAIVTLPKGQTIKIYEGV
jgi:large subunit ribosomal protein L23